ncbi:phage antirepressor protein, partial [Candidatus Pacearchaeota archaeon]|nr:phage antirepressor protein [Candidatus Pacearchaeota archaeon]
KATFGVSIREHKIIKDLSPVLKNQNLRDPMTDLELIFNMLGEASISEIERVQNPENFDEHKIVAKEGGKVAGNARKELEVKIGKNVISDENYLDVEEKYKKKLLEVERE